MTISTASPRRALAVLGTLGAIASPVALAVAPAPASAQPSAARTGHRHHVVRRHHRAHRVHRAHHLVAGARSASGTAVVPKAAASPAVVVPSGPCAGADLTPDTSNTAQVQAAVVCLINQQRAAHGESGLRLSNALTGAALGHSSDMVNNDYFDHVSPSGQTPEARVRATGYIPANYSYELGENIALGTLNLSTPSATVQAWMNSPEHRANILNPDFTDTGVGVTPQAPPQYSNGESGATYTQEFGALASNN